MFQSLFLSGFIRNNMSLYSMRAHGQRRDNEEKRGHEGRCLIKQGRGELGLKEGIG